MQTINSDELDKLRKSVDDEVILSNDQMRASMNMDLNNSKINFEEVLNFRSSYKSMERKGNQLESGPDLKERALEEITKIENDDETA